jgi:hypothetical protein
MELKIICQNSISLFGMTLWVACCQIFSQVVYDFWLGTAGATPIRTKMQRFLGMWLKLSGRDARDYGVYA